NLRYRSSQHFAYSNFFCALSCRIYNQSKKPEATDKNSKPCAPVKQVSCVLFLFIKFRDAFIKKLIIEFLFRINFLPGLSNTGYCFFPVICIFSFWWQGNVKSVMLFCLAGKGNRFNRRVQ